MLQVMRNSNENVERLGLSQDGSRDVKCRDRDIFFIVYVISFGFLSKVQILSLVKKWSLGLGSCFYANILWMLQSSNNLLALLICSVIFVQPLKRELYTMHPVTFFVPSFMKAINDNTEDSLRSIISEPSPGVLTFEMLQPRFCELLVAEVNLMFYCHM